MRKITREVDRNQTGSITAAIVKSIAKADVAVVDITGRNPNVFLAAWVFVMHYVVKLQYFWRRLGRKLLLISRYIVILNTIVLNLQKPVPELLKR